MIDEIKTKLVFHLFCQSAEDVSEGTETYSNSIHRRILSKYSDKFDKAVFCLTLNDVNDRKTASAAVKWIMSCGFGSNLEIKIKQNDWFRDARTFFEEIVNKNPERNEVVMFSHNKGATHGNESEHLQDNVTKWTVFSYYSIFRNFESNVRDLNKDGLVCGYVPVHGAVTPWNYSTLNRYGWHTPGTILLTNPSNFYAYALKNGKPLPLLKDYLSGEMFFGNLFDLVEAKPENGHNVLFEGMRDVYYETTDFNPYEFPHSDLIRVFLEEEVAAQYDQFFEMITNE